MEILVYTLAALIIVLAIAVHYLFNSVAGLSKYVLDLTQSQLSILGMLRQHSKEDTHGN